MYTAPLKDAEVAINDGLRSVVNSLTHCCAWPRWLKSVVKIKVNPKLYIPTKDIIKVMLGPFNYSFVVQWKDSTK